MRYTAFCSIANQFIVLAKSSERCLSYTAGGDYEHKVSECLLPFCFNSENFLLPANRPVYLLHSMLAAITYLIATAPDFFSQLSLPYQNTLTVTATSSFSQTIMLPQRNNSLKDPAEIQLRNAFHKLVLISPNKALFNDNAEDLFRALVLRHIFEQLNLRRLPVDEATRNGLPENAFDDLHTSFLEHYGQDLWPDVDRQNESELSRLMYAYFLDLMTIPARDELLAELLGEPKDDEIEKKKLEEGRAGSLEVPNLTAEDFQPSDDGVSEWEGGSRISDDEHNVAEESEKAGGEAEEKIEPVSPVLERAEGYKCMICGTKFLNSTDLLDHHQTEHGD